MKLLLARHGLALDSDVDPQRALSAAGIAEVQQVARQLANAGIRPARVWHSGKMRAQQTAELLARALAPRAVPEQVTGLAPNDPVDEFAVDADVWQDDTLVVGHLPFMGRLLSLLLTGDAERLRCSFPAAGVACLERDGAGVWVLHWMLGPGQCRGGKS